MTSERNPFGKEFLSCIHCKKKINNVEDMLFVEEERMKGFCSEDCIEKFFKHAIFHYENIDQKIRADKKLSNEDCLKFVGIPKYMEAAIRRPSEIWCLKNSLDEKVYSFIAHLRDNEGVPFYMVLFCTVLDKRPSFIFLATATRNHDYLALLRIGHEIKDKEYFYNPEDQSESNGLGPETLEIIEGKKSKHLAWLLEKMSPSDIPFEDFAYYDSYLTPTLENPDEVYKYRDEEGDDIIVTIKACELNHLSFYYFVICLSHPHKSPEKSFEAGTEQEEILYPIISFPSNDGEIYHTYKKGAMLAGVLKS